MNIKTVDKWQVRVPCRAGVLESHSFDPLYAFDHIPKWIVRLVADNGLTGVGESMRGESEARVDRAIESLLGADLDDIPLDRLPIPDDERTVYTTFEMAVVDLLGKARDVPAYELLGGAKRPVVPLSYWSARHSTARTVECALEGRALGFTGIKIKAALAASNDYESAETGLPPVNTSDDVVETARGISLACGRNFHITIDANLRFYSSENTLALLEAGLERLNIILEDPFPWSGRLDEYRKLREQTGVPVALHLQTEAELRAAIDADAADCFNIHAPMSGFGRCAALCAEAGRPWWHASGVDCGIRDASYLHASLSGEGHALPGDMIGSFMREDDLVVEPIRIEDGYLRAPAAPGLGITLDEAAIARYAV